MHLLQARLRGLGSVLVGLSGGADSVLLARVAHDCLGARAAALTAVSASLAAEEREWAARAARQIGIRHLEVQTREFDNPDYLRNAADRCFHCKTELFSVMAHAARELGIRWLAYGAITDDLQDVRPGMRAAGRAGAVAPLLEAGMGKEDVRSLSRILQLPTWDKPAAACLASRVPHGTPIQIEVLGKVERLESFLRRQGFNLCRVRIDGDGARIEVEPGRVADLLRAPLRQAVSAEARRVGFRSARADLDGYRPGGAAGARRATPL
jgi:uncharacterized protein